MVALLGPRRARRRAYWAAREVFLLRLALLAHSTSVWLSHLEPLRVLPVRRLPADSSLPGHMPAQEARCLAVGKTLMSPPVSAMITSAARRPTPGIVHKSSTAGAKGPSCFSIAAESSSIASSR